METTATSYTVADLTVRGELMSKQSYTYGLLEQVPGAGDLIVSLATQLYRSPEGFEWNVNDDLIFHWRGISTSTGLGFTRCDGVLMSLSVLACGLDDDDDRITLESLHRHWLKESRQIGMEPSFALMELKERPLVAIFDLGAPVRQEDKIAVSLLDRCFAAAFFRYHGLA